jgi:hypothetical protein
MTTETTATLDALRDAYRAAAIRGGRPDATSADHAAWLAAQSAYYKAGGRDPANGWPLLSTEATEALTRVSEEAAAWLVKYGHFDRIGRDPRRYCVDNWGGHSDSVAHALGRPLTADETAALEACIRARLGVEAEPKITASERSGSSHATAPALKPCAWCGRSLDMRKRSTFALYGGDIICARRHDDEVRDLMGVS